MHKLCLLPLDMALTLLQAEGASRDVLLLDIALDNYFRLCIERTDKSSLSGDDLLDMAGLVLSNACIAGESQDFGQVSALTFALSCVFHSCCMLLRCSAAAVFLCLWCMQGTMGTDASTCEQPELTIGHRSIVTA